MTKYDLLKIELMAHMQLQDQINQVTYKHQYKNCLQFLGALGEALYASNLRVSLLAIQAKK